MSISSIGSQPSFNPALMATKFAKKMVGDLDANSDGSIDKSEFTKGATSKGISEIDSEKIFGSIDADGNGSVTQSEIEDSMKKMGGPKGPPPSGGAPQGASAKPAGGSGSSEESSKVYDDADLNQDGTVSSMEQMVYQLKHAAESMKEINEQTNQSGTYSQFGSVMKEAGERAQVVDVYA